MGISERWERAIAKSPDWSASEDDVLRTWYPEYGMKWDRWDDLLPSRTRRAIQNRAQKLGVRCRYRGPKSWRKSEDRAAVAALAEVCRTTGRTPEAVIRRLDHLIHMRRKHMRKERECDSE